MRIWQIDIVFYESPRDGGATGQRAKVSKSSLRKKGVCSGVLLTGEGRVHPSTVKPLSALLVRATSTNALFLVCGGGRQELSSSLAQHSSRRSESLMGSPEMLVQ